MTPPIMREMGERLAAIADQAELERLLGTMTLLDLVRFDGCFEAWLHEGQTPPRAEGWRTWLMMGGRGYGKTRAGAEWITSLATQRRRPVRIALVAATEADARAVMVEGESGLLWVGRYHGCAPRWEPSRGRLLWPGGSEAQVFSGADPDGLRGPAHHFAWCDELAKWARPEETWDNLQMTLRCGARPRALVTTTPRAIPILTRIEGAPGTIASRGRTDDNKHLPEAFMEAMIATYGGTRLGRQELDGELIADIEGALWTRELVEACRLLPGTGRWQPAGLTEGVPGRARGESPLHHASHGPPPRAGEDFRRVVIGVDPPVSVGGDACGIVACGLGADGIGYVLGDHSVRGMSPEGWARAVAGAAVLHGADRVIAEANQGGAMVESVLRAADSALPVRLVHASRGKSARAEPVAALFETGRAKFAGAFPALEDELCGMTIGGGYEGPGRSPDRADAMVWAMTELMLGKARAELRVSVL